MLLMALLAPWAAMAQETTLTVCDGTATNSYIPIYGLYVDTKGQNSEFIIPGETTGMSDLEGGTISKLAFYISGSPATWGSPTVQVYMGEVEGTTISSLYGPTNFTTVWTGVLSNQNSIMEITLSEPYTYEGGNLLIGMYVQTKSSTYKTTYFSGITAPLGSSRYNAGSGAGTAQSFLPKTTFTYTPGSGSSCAKPTAITTNTHIHYVELDWTAPDGQEPWQIVYSTESDFDPDQATPINVTSKPYVLEGLDSGTTYYLYVRGYCGTDVSPWSAKKTFTTDYCHTPTALNVDDMTPSSATISWNGSVEEYDIEWSEYTQSSEAFWLKYDDGTLATSIGNSSYYTWTWGVMYPASMLSGGYLFKVSVYENEYYTMSSYTIKIYEGGDTAPETLIGTETVTPSGLNGFHEILISDPIAVDPEKNLWITITGYGGYILSACTVNNPNNTWVLNGSTWAHIGDLSSSLADYGWMIRGFIDNPSFDWTVVEGVTSPYTIEGLNPETSYIVKVRSLCSDENSESEWVGARFTTPSGCELPEFVSSIPGSFSDTLEWSGYSESYNLRYVSDIVLHENFDNYNVLSYGWTEIDGDDDGNTWGRSSWSSGEPSHSGKYFMRSQDRENMHPNNYLITPQVPLEGTLSFWAYAGNPSAEHFGVYVSNKSNTDTTDFEMVEEWTMTQGQVWTHFTVDLNNYGGQPGYIAFRHFNCTNQWILCIDDVVLYGPRAQWVMFEGVDPTNEEPFVLEDLQPYTEYEVQVQGNCPSGDVTDWSQSLFFTTLKACLPPVSSHYLFINDTIGPFSYGMHWKVTGEDNPEVLDFSFTPYNQPDEGIIVTVENDTIVEVFDLLPSTTYHVYFRTNCGAFDVSDWSSSYVKSFTTAVACKQIKNLAVSDVTHNTATATWEAGGEETSWQVVVKIGSSYPTEEDDIITVTDPTCALTDLLPSTSYYAFVRAYCDETYQSAWSYKYFTTGNACPTVNVSSITVSGITENSATATWTAGGEETSWQVVIKTTSSTPTDADEIIPVSTPTCTFSGLNAGTTYYVFVRANCDEVYHSPWSSYKSFTTSEPCPEGMVCIGSGTSTNSYLPTYTYYNYSLTQQIYTAEEIGQAGTITSVDFYKSGTYQASRNIDIYMVTTDKATFSGKTDWITVTANDLVYSGNVSFATNGWNTVALSTPFIYDGTSNVALIVDDNTGSYVSSPSFYVFDATSQAIRIYSDGTNYDPFSPTTYNGTVLNVKNRVRLGIEGAVTCSKPSGLTVNYTGGTTAEVSWNSAATAWNIDVNGTVTAITQNPYTLTGLEFATNYEVMVQANCGGGDLSDWSNAVSFTTDLCLSENQCEITLELTDSYGDGWNGAAIRVTDVETGVILGDFANTSAAGAGEAQTYTLAVCDGRDIQFTWVSGNYDYEASYVVKAFSGDVIFSGSDELSGPVNYTMSCSTCRKPTNITVSEIEGHSVKLNWTENGEATAWQIAYSEENFETEYDEDVEVVDADAKPFVLTQLYASTLYYVRVRALCGNEYSSWSDYDYFVTGPSCPPITDLVASHITTTGATLNWRPGSDEVLWEIRWKSDDDEEWMQDAAFNDSTYTIYDCQPYTTYQVEVRANCDAILNDYSPYLDILVTTAAELPYEEAFGETYLPADYVRYFGSMPGEQLIPGYHWKVGAHQIWDTEAHPYLEIAGSNTRDWLVTPYIELFRGTVEMSFDLALTAYSYNYAPLPADESGDDDVFAVLVTTDEGETWTPIRVWDNAASEFVYNDIATEGETITLDLTPYQGKVVRIAFYGESTELNADNFLHITNIIIDGEPVIGEEQVLSLSSGWTWFSSYITYNEETLDVFADALADVPGIPMLKNNAGYATLNDGVWDGSLTSLNNNSMYMTKLDSDAEVTLLGELVEDAEITLSPGWSWIAYPVNAEMTLQDALANITPNVGDLVKDMTTFSSYTAEGWNGNLNVMQPGMGYMYLNAGETALTLVYPEPDMRDVVTPVEVEKYWKANYHRFPTNLSMMVTIDPTMFALREGNYEVGAFVNGECRGSARLQYVSGNYVAFLTVTGVDGEEVNFKLYDVYANKVSGNAEEHIVYTANDVIGNVANPMMLHFSFTDVDDNETAVMMFPNPAKDKLFVNGEAIETVRVFNALGQMVYSEEFSGVAQVELNMGAYSAGVYTVSVRTNGQVINKMIVKE